MHEPSYAFLKKLLETPSPSGYERPIQEVVRHWAKPLAQEVRTDRHGNVLAVINPGGQPRVMLAGHCDQIGLMVQHIDENGYLYVQPIGGWDMQIVLGQALTVWTAQGPVADGPCMSAMVRGASSASCRMVGTVFTPRLVEANMSSAVIAGVIIWIVVTVLSHLHVAISWH